MSNHRSKLVRLTRLLLAVTAVLISSFVVPEAAHAQLVPTPPDANAPALPIPGRDSDIGASREPTASINIDFGSLDGEGEGAKPGQSVVIILLLSLLAVAPALLIMLTSFTRIVIVLSLTRNALGLTTIPPNQVVIGLSLFLSLFVMLPTLSEVNEKALKPLLDGEMTTKEAYDEAQAPIRGFMLDQTRSGELDLFIQASRAETPETRDDVSMATLIPAFVLSELKTAFIIGFVVFVPFLIIDLVVSSTLMSMGMFMLPPILVSLPFKLLLFVMVDGWALVVKSLITSFN